MNDKPRFKAVLLNKGWYVVDRTTFLTVCGPVAKEVAEYTAETKNQRHTKEKQ